MLSRLTEEDIESQLKYIREYLQYNIAYIITIGSDITTGIENGFNVNIRCIYYRDRKLRQDKKLYSIAVSYGKARYRKQMESIEKRVEELLILNFIMDCVKSCVRSLIYEEME